MKDRVSRQAEGANVWLSLGANLGNPVESVKEAIRALSRTTCTELVRCSSLYRTAPIGHRDQPIFINAAASIRTTLSPMDLLAELHAIESSLGRKDRPRWREREIDIDILIYDSRHFESDLLSIPHKRMHERAFVLVPLNEIAPDLTHPVFGKTVRELLESLPSDENSWVERIAEEDVQWEERSS